MMNTIRWWLFVQISNIGWRICPEPQRSFVQRGIGTWEDVKKRATEPRRPVG